ncbi:MFS transporter, partial [Mycolicibacterium sphagni]|nr:MFS transporter [Mycolicibacterium sphagni]
MDLPSAGHEPGVPPRGTDAQSGGSSLRKVGAASLLGTTIEYYDFFVYGTAAALAFPTVFFP